MLDRQYEVPPYLFDGMARTRPTPPPHNDFQELLIQKDQKFNEQCKRASKMSYFVGRLARDMSPRVVGV